nr:hypothetical protein GCM10025730_24390 [Promicromonospora thailandica]
MADPCQRRVPDTPGHCARSVAICTNESSDGEHRRPHPLRRTTPRARTTTPSRHLLTRLAAAVLPAALVLSGAAVPAAGLDDDAEPPHDAVGTSAAGAAGDQDPDLGDGRYVVVLRDPAAATYDGGIAGLRATAVPEGARLRASSPDVQAYDRYLTGRQEDVARDLGVEAFASYTTTTNGFAAELTGEQAAALLTDPRVADVVPNEILHVADEAAGAAGASGMATSTDYLGLSGDDGVWASVGGPDEAGAGTVVGVVDTGIAPENPSFAGEPLGTDPGDEPYLDGDTVTYERSDGGTFTGRCTTGAQFDADACSTKVIGARYYVDGFGADFIGDESVAEYLSPRDGAGHGSHTASTAAGNAGVEVTSPVPAVVSGVAPAARIAVYKACWSGPDPASTDDDGCATADLLAAIDDAVADGVDVLNYSIGGAPGSTFSLTDQAFLAASAAGVFVAAAGGNSGPDESTVDNLAPWITTVAATTYPSSEATVRTGSGDAFVGASVTVPEGGVTGPLVDAADVALAGADEPELCGPGTLDPRRTAGAVVLCRRGTVDRVAKSAEVARAGGIGMVLVNPEPSSLDLDAHSVPTVHVDSSALAALSEYAATGDATVTLEDGNTTGQETTPVPQVAGFSSRGPVTVDGGDLVKPDVAAPGVNVLAAGANPAGAPGAHVFMSGTSMASPHVAGLAALYLGERPTASVAEVKSALMTSAVDTVGPDGAPQPDPAAQGNGQVVPASYLRPGLLYLAGLDDWKAYVQGSGAGDLGVTPVDPSDLNLPSVGIGGLAGTQSVTRTVTAAQAGTWTAEVSGLAGVDVAVEPSSLVFGSAGEQQDVTLTIARRDAALGDQVTGYLTWSGDGVPAVRSALAVRPVALDVPPAVDGSGTTGSVEIAANVGRRRTSR